MDIKKIIGVSAPEIKEFLDEKSASGESENYASKKQSKEEAKKKAANLATDLIVLKSQMKLNIQQRVQRLNLM